VYTRLSMFRAEAEELVLIRDSVRICGGLVEEFPRTPRAHVEKLYMLARISDAIGAVGAM